EVWEKVELLVNKGDAAAFRFARIGVSERFSGDTDFASVRAQIAAQNIHQGGFACAVLANDAKHRSFRNAEGNVLQHAHAEERLVDSAKFQRRVHSEPIKRRRVASSTAARRMTEPLEMVIANCERFIRFSAVSRRV